MQLNIFKLFEKKETRNLVSSYYAKKQKGVIK